MVKRAEELGYTHAWFYDTQLLNAELFGAMAAAAMKTSKIKLGTGVVIPSNRIAPVTASGLGTINALAPAALSLVYLQALRVAERLDFALSRLRVSKHT